VHIWRRSSPSHSRHAGVCLVCDDSKCSVGQSLQFEQKCHRCEPSPLCRRNSVLATAPPCSVRKPPPDSRAVRRCTHQVGGALLLGTEPCAHTPCRAISIRRRRRRLGRQVDCLLRNCWDVARPRWARVPIYLEVSPHCTIFPDPGIKLAVVLGVTWYWRQSGCRPSREVSESSRVCTGE
jgi:hypothetical protein